MWLRFLSLDGSDKIRNYSVANPICMYIVDEGIDLKRR